MRDRGVGAGRAGGMSESQVGEGRGVKPWPGLTRVGERTRLGSRGPGLYPHGEPRVLWGGRACRSAPPSVAVIACAAPRLAGGNLSKN